MDPWSECLISPRSGPDVCDVCFNLTDGYSRCYACSHGDLWLDAVVPISYSVAGERLHQVLRGYKLLPSDLAVRLRLEVAEILSRFLAAHEACVATAAAVGGFDLVCSVPSSDPKRDAGQPLRWIVAEAVDSTRERHERLLMVAASPAAPHSFDRTKFQALRPLDGEAILLVDDTWTTGANARSAAAALKIAGAGAVAAVVVGRHLNRAWHENERRLHALVPRFDWAECALCGREGVPAVQTSAPAVSASVLSVPAPPVRAASTGG